MRRIQSKLEYRIHSIFSRPWL